MSNKLVVYVDGSYRNKKGGWGYLYYFNNNFTNQVIGSGACILKDNNQAEIVACIKALENIEIDRNIDVDYIEVRSDYLEMVKVMNQVTQFYYTSLSDIENKLGRQNTVLTIKLAQLIIQSDYTIKFYKASKKDISNLKVHNLAKHALNTVEIEVDDVQERYKSVMWKKFNTEVISCQVANEKTKDIVPWANKNDIGTQLVEVDIKKVMLCDEMHLRTQSIYFGDFLYKSKKNNKLDAAIVIRKLESDKYALVLGIRSYCIAKILGINKVNAFITELSRKEFVRQKLLNDYDIKESGNMEEQK